MIKQPEKGNEKENLCLKIEGGKRDRVVHRENSRIRPVFDGYVQMDNVAKLQNIFRASTVT